MGLIQDAYNDKKTLEYIIAAVLIIGVALAILSKTGVTGSSILIILSIFTPSRMIACALMVLGVFVVLLVCARRKHHFKLNDHKRK